MIQAKVIKSPYSSIKAGTIGEVEKVRVFKSNPYSHSRKPYPGGYKMYYLSGLPNGWFQQHEVEILED